MSDEAGAGGKDPAEEILEEVLGELDDFLPGELREQLREMLLDANAAHPVTRLLAARVRDRVAPERSGASPIEEEDVDDGSKAASGGSK